MFDYYSERPQPSVQVRTDDLFRTAICWLVSKKIPIDDLRIMVNSVIITSKVYSFSGYSVFGKTENENNLYKIINKKEYIEDFKS